MAACCRPGRSRNARRRPGAGRRGGRLWRATRLPLADKPYFAARWWRGARFAGRRWLPSPALPAAEIRRHVARLRRRGAGLTAFADHHPYSAAEQALIAAKAANAGLVTTADWVRCRRTCGPPAPFWRLI